ncbi:MAG: GAF domain-containing protein [Gammaproteobacteria bacterium]|nr:GAF domain-containing protein [Gammaproteobacteria bacterium]
MQQDKNAFYHRLYQQAAGLFDGERDYQANCANLAALLFLELDEINWVGFYRNVNQELVLGAFQGKPACTRIPTGAGVCGTAAARRESVIVDNVHDFDGHIACDGASNSELVVPVICAGNLLGVLDVDSPVIARFSETDARGLETLVTLLLEASDVQAQDLVC